MAKAKVSGKLHPLPFTPAIASNAARPHLSPQIQYYLTG
jgi:hypothetical protein